LLQTTRHNIEAINEHRSSYIMWWSLADLYETIVFI